MTAKKTKHHNIRKHCDALWSELVKLRAGNKCDRCESTHMTQGHHIIPRTNWNLRYEIDNGVCLCLRHHLFWAHKDVISFTNWINRKYSGRIERLELKRNGKARHDYTLIKLYLEGEIKKYKTSSQSS